MAETLVPAGVKMEIDDPGARGLRHAPARGRPAGRRLRRRQRHHRLRRLRVQRAPGRRARARRTCSATSPTASTRRSASTHVPVPEWRIQPFFSIGTGVIRIRAEGRRWYRTPRPHRPGRLCRRRRARLPRPPLHPARRVQGIRGLHRPRRKRGRHRMENRIRILLLSAAASLAAGCSRCRGARTQPDRRAAAAAEAGEAPVVIEPQVERREIKAAEDRHRELGGRRLCRRRFGRGLRGQPGLRRAASPITSARTSSPRRSSGTSDAGLSSFERLSGGAPY